MKIKIIYGSELGTTKFVAELMKRQLEALSHQVQLYRTGNDGYTPALNDSDLIIFASSTYFGYQLEETMKEYTSNSVEDLSQRKIGLFVLGDSGYPNFCGSAATLENWVKERGGTPLTTTLKLDGYPKDPQITQTWLVNLLKKVNK